MTEGILPSQVQTGITSFCQEAGVDPGRCGLRNHIGTDGKTAGYELRIGEKFNVVIFNDGSFNPSRGKHVEEAKPHVAALKAMDQVATARIAEALANHVPGQVESPGGVIFSPSR